MVVGPNLNHLMLIPIRQPILAKCRQLDGNRRQPQREKFGHLSEFANSFVFGCAPRRNQTAVRRLVPLAYQGISHDFAVIMLASHRAWLRIYGERW
jgi:hypothetical protein